MRDAPQTIGLEDLLKEIGAAARLVAPAWFPELQALVSEDLFPYHAPPHSLLPIIGACCSDGNPRQAVPLAAGWSLLMAAARVLDDCQDGDNEAGLERREGVARAVNLGTALLVLGQDVILRACGEGASATPIGYLHTATLRVCAGQDRDLKNTKNNLKDYVRLIEDKTATMFATGMGLGAMLNTTDPDIIEAAEAAGHHLGFMIQLVDDLESMWFAETSSSDLVRGRWTFPVFIGLEQNHPDVDALRAVLERVETDPDAQHQVRAILDSMHVRDLILDAAVEERERAVAALSRCPDGMGARILGVFCDWVLRDARDMRTLTL